MKDSDLKRVTWTCLILIVDSLTCCASLILSVQSYTASQGKDSSFLLHKHPEKPWFGVFFYRYIKASVCARISIRTALIRCCIPDGDSSLAGVSSGRNTHRAFEQIRFVIHASASALLIRLKQQLGACMTTGMFFVAAKLCSYRQRVGLYTVWRVHIPIE